MTDARAARPESRPAKRGNGGIADAYRNLHRRDAGGGMDVTHVRDAREREHTGL